MDQVVKVLKTRDINTNLGEC